MKAYITLAESYDCDGYIARVITEQDHIARMDGWNNSYTHVTETCDQLWVAEEQAKSWAQWAGYTIVDESEM